MTNKLPHKQCPAQILKTSPAHAIQLRAYYCWHLVNHTRRDQKSNVSAPDEALEKSNKNEK